MPKSKLIKDLVNDKVNLQQTLARLKVIAHDVKNKELEDWAENELVGYRDDVQVPDYRIAKSLNFTYTGINNFTLKVTNVPLDISFIDKDDLEALKEIQFREDVRSLENFLDFNGAVLSIDRTYLAPEIASRTGDALQCFTIAQNVPKSFVQKALAAIKNRALNALIMLEDEYGNLDGVDIDVSDEKPSKIERINDRINEKVLHIEVESAHQTEEPVRKKIAWNIIVPIFTAVIAAILSALLASYFGL